jgi:translation initiation factor 1 (eIF-1/SUI1)
MSYIISRNKADATGVKPPS